MESPRAPALYPNPKPKINFSKKKLNKNFSFHEIRTGHLCKWTVTDLSRNEAGIVLTYYTLLFEIPRNIA